MSAVAMYLADDGVVFAADGAAYDTDGRLLYQATKLHHSAEQAWAFGHVGIGGFGSALFSRIPTPHPDFDWLRSNLVQLARDSYSEVEAQWNYDTPPARATLVVAGWSAKDGRFVATKIHSSPKEIQDQITGEVSVAPAWTALPVGEFWASSIPKEDAQARFGVNDAPDPLEMPARYVCALRATCDDWGDAVYGVGCFLEMLVVTADQTLRWTAHEWPDPLGQAIDPAVGTPMPDFPLRPPADSRVREDSALGRRRLNE